MQMSRHRDYGARQVYEAEHGVCQLCQFDAEAFYKRLRYIVHMSLCSSFFSKSIIQSIWNF